VRNLNHCILAVYGIQFALLVEHPAIGSCGLAVVVALGIELPAGFEQGLIPLGSKASLRGYFYS